MRCPSCDYQSPFESVRCPSCQTTFDARLLEELAHLDYLQDRLRDWQADGLLSDEVATLALEQSWRELKAIEQKLGLGAPVGVAVAAPPATAPAPAMAAPVALAPSGPALSERIESVALVPPRPSGPPAVGAPPPHEIQPGIPAAPKAHPRPTSPAPARPLFAWADVGTYLLSERTLHALLGLGAFLILASGVVISTVNPTHLGPWLHLSAVFATTLLFYAAGYVVRQKLNLGLTGAALLAIGGAFVPLIIWTLGQEQLLNWDRGAIWLAASLLCLPLYLASHAVLRDRTFAVLTALAGGSELLALLNWLGVPLEWGLSSLVMLALGYLLLARRLRPEWDALAWALFSTAQVATPLVLVLLMVARFYPVVYEVGAGRPLGGWYEYAVGTAWWLGSGFYALAARLFERRRYVFLAAWTVPVAYLFTLTKAPWDAAWYNLCLAILAGAYLLFGRFAQRGWWVKGRAPTYERLAGDAVFQVALLLTTVAALWPRQTQPSEIATLLALSAVYGSAAAVLRQRAWAYVSVYLVPIAFVLVERQLALEPEFRPLAWAALSAVLLAGAESAATGADEARRSLLETISGRGAWRSRFASPLFSAGYAVSLVALWLGLEQYWRAPAAAGVRYISVPVVLGLLGVVALYTLSAVGRRSSFFLYPATWLFLAPFTAAARLVYRDFGLPILEHDLARLLAALGIAYLALGLLVDRAGRHYSKPIYLVGYALTLATMLLSVLDRTAIVQVVGLSVLVYVASAWLVHRGRHTAYLWVVERLFRDHDSAAYLTARALFLYLACWLFPAWLLLALSLRQPAPLVAHYGLALALLAPAYAALGRRIRHIRTEYRWPWYLAAYALSAIGPLVAVPDHTLRAVALAISIGLYIASAIVSRHSVWLYAVALLTPVLLWQMLDSFALFERYYGLGLVALGLAYATLGLLLHHGSPRRLVRPLRGPIGPYGLPFVVVGYALAALGLARVANQERELVVLGFLLGALYYAGSALVARQSLFGYPVVATLAVAYVVGMTLTPLDARFYGLGLLPGLATCLALAERLRRRFDAPTAASSGLAGLRLDSWSAPFYATAYLATAAMPFSSTADQGVWALAWWAVAAVYLVSTVLFRHPGWLYPALGAGLIGYAATAYVVAPTLPLPDLAASLLVPVWLLFWLAYAVVRLKRLPVPQSLYVGLSSRVALDLPRGLSQRWAAPLLAWGWVVLLVATLGALPDSQAGLRTAITGAVLLAIFALLWQGSVEVWASLILAGIAFQQALRVLDVPLIDQSPCWALAALMLSLLAIALKQRPPRLLELWTRPLYLTSIGAGGLAMLGAVALQLAHSNRVGLQPLAATSVLTGLTLIAHGFDRRERILGYQGVALLEVGYMLQLVFFDVGQPQAFVLPAGLYLLGVALLEWRRGTGARIKPPLETSALTLMLGVSLLQAIGFLGAGHDRYVYDTFLLLESVALFGLGAVLHWKRSFLAGALALVLDVAILLADPLRAMNTWYLVALIGFAMIGLVIFVERQRQRIPFWLDEWRARLETWD